jgi:phosphatidylserine decarboxylase
MFTGRTLAEGIWPIAILAILAGVGIYFRCWTTTAIILALLAFVVSFFRDPDRRSPTDPQLIVAPADGRIVEIKPAGTGTMVAIFLSVFNVHVQRAPVAGEIKTVRYTKGKFLDARDPQAGPLNENRSVVLESADGFRVEVRQIAGLIARRIVGWAGEGDRVFKGDRIGMIRFGSRVELYLPADVEILAQIGQTAKGGETVVARRK